MKFNNTIKLVSRMKSLPRGETDGKKPAAWPEASQKAKTAPSPPKLSRTHKPDDIALEDWQRALRRQFGEQQPFVLKNVGGHPLFSEFALTNPESGKTYKIAIRGEAPGMNYCSCPDYRINNLGTCKHIEFTLAKLSQQPGAEKRLREGYAPIWSEIWLSYGLKREIMFRAGQDAPAELSALSEKYFDGRGVLREDRLLDFHTFLEAIPRRNGHEVRCYDDVMAYVAECQDAAHRRAVVNARLPEGIESPLFDALLKTDLYPYQREGALFAVRAGRCLLGDDMGLGKTIQVLALLLLLRQQKASRTPPATGPALLVVPASLVANWKAEIGRFAPSLAAFYAHPSETPAAALAMMADAKRRAATLSGMDIVITTYAMVHRVAWLREVPWGLLILDEAQAVKNPGARQTRAVKALQGKTRIILSGTPLENRLGDLWSLFDFLCPGLLGTEKVFSRYTKGTGDGTDNAYAALRTLVRPYILRRLKTDRRIIADLPDKVEVKVFCPLTKTQATLYGESVREMAEKLKETEGIQRRGLVLAYLMRFKQICNHPSQWLGDQAYGNGASGKFQRLRTLCEEIASRQEKLLVFTQFREMTEPLAALLAEVFLRPGLVLHGGTGVGKRREIVDAFQREEGPPFFVLSLKAGGLGLNLTAASHVIHFDRWWNPAVENQATDRAYRIGQKKNVLVHKFVCRGTIEEKIDALIESKKDLAESILGTGEEKLLTEMPDDELIRFVSLDLARALDEGNGGGEMKGRRSGG